MWGWVGEYPPLPSPRWCIYEEDDDMNCLLVPTIYLRSTNAVHTVDGEAILDAISLGEEVKAKTSINAA